MNVRDHNAGEGGTAEATQVEPTTMEPERAEEGTGGIAVPIGTPVAGDRLSELKRRAERPDPSHEASATEEDPAQRSS